MRVWRKAGGYLHFKDLNFIDRRGIQNIVNKMSEMSPEVKAVAQELMEFIKG